MRNIDIDLKNQVAIVTGGSQGIGAATAVAMGRAGAIVVLTYNRSKPKALKVLDEIRQAGAQSIALHLDLQNRDSIHLMVSETLKRFGRIDILINNAAVGSASVFHYASLENQDQAMVEINVHGVLLCVQGILPIMVDQNYGKIINVSSVAGGISAFPHFRMSDGMSKASVSFLSKQIVADYPHHKIDAFSICPGAVDTRMFRESTLDPLSAEDRKKFIASLPLGRLIEPQEIADLILFLCTPASAVCRGAVIDASLGLGVRPGLLSEMK